MATQTTQNTQTILIIRTGGLGDSLLLWPAVAAVRRRFPGARIDLMGIRSRLELLVGPGGADRALDVEGSGLHHLFEISVEPPDDVSLRFGAYSAVVAFAAPGDYALAENLSACGAGEVHAFLPFPPEDEALHVAEHALRSLAGVDLAAPGDLPRLPVSDPELSLGLEHLRAASLSGVSLALVAPGSGSATKNWPADRFASLAAELRAMDLEPALLQGPADSEAVGAVQAAGDHPLPVLADQSPAVLKGALAHANLYVGNDAGPTHLSALIGTPTVAVFGPSDPTRWRPLGPRVELVNTEPHELENADVPQVLAACRRVLGT